jgi:hypothetical protein
LLGKFGLSKCAFLVVVGDEVFFVGEEWLGNKGRKEDADLTAMIMCSASVEK